MACIVRAIKVVEDAIHVVVAVLLTALGVALIIYTLRHIAVILTGPHNVPAIVPAVLNEILLLLIVAELLHAVAIAINMGVPWILGPSSSWAWSPVSAGCSS